MSGAALSDWEWLTSDDAEPWLAQAASDSGSLTTLTATLRRSLSAERAHLVLQQVALRARAVEKFPSAAKMFFTPRALQQATDHGIAAYKALRFPAGQPVADLCCGIGGDLMALAARGAAFGIDRDPVAVRLAQANAEATAVGHSLTLECLDLATDSDQLPCNAAAVHIDPDRRPEQRRTTRLNQFAPSLDVLDRLRTSHQNLAVKIAPASDIPAAWQDAEREWISRRGECRQQVAWFGDLARAPGLRRATRVDNKGYQTLVGAGDVQPVESVTHVGRRIHEPDPAVIAAGLVGELSVQTGWAPLDPRIAYLTGDALDAHPMAQSFEVIDTFAFELLRVRKAVHALGWGRLEIKLRGVPYRPESLRHQLRLQGSGSGSLLIARVGSGAVAILAQRCQSS